MSSNINDFQASLQWNKICNEFKLKVPKSKKKVLFKTYHNCFTGQEALNCMSDILKKLFPTSILNTAAQSSKILQLFCDYGLLKDAVSEKNQSKKNSNDEKSQSNIHKFKHDNHLYCFDEKEFNISLFTTNTKRQSIGIKKSLSMTSFSTNPEAKSSLNSNDINHPTNYNLSPNKPKLQSSVESVICKNKQNVLTDNGPSLRNSLLLNLPSQIIMSNLQSMLPKSEDSHNYNTPEAPVTPICSTESGINIETKKENIGGCYLKNIKLSNDEVFLMPDLDYNENCHNPASIKLIKNEIIKLCKNILNEELTECFNSYSSSKFIHMNIISDISSLIRTLPGWFVTCLKYLTRFPSFNIPKSFENINQQVSIIDDIIEIIDNQFLHILEGESLFPKQLLDYFISQNFDNINYAGSVISFRLLLLGFNPKLRDILRLLIIFASKCFHNSFLIHFYEINNSDATIEEIPNYKITNFYFKIRSMITCYFVPKGAQITREVQNGLNKIFDLLVDNESIIFQPFQNLNMIEDKRLCNMDKYPSCRIKEFKSHPSSYSPLDKISKSVSSGQTASTKDLISSPVCKSETNNITKESLSELLEQIFHNNKITSDKKDQLLYLFKLNHPEIYNRRFAL